MAVITARNLVLHGDCVTRDVLACVKTKGFRPAYDQTEAMFQSPRLVHGVRETNPGKRPDIHSDGQAVFGAGRLQRFSARIPSRLASSDRASCGRRAPTPPRALPRELPPTATTPSRRSARR